MCADFFFVPSHLLYSPFFSLSILVVTQIRGHIARSSPPSQLLYVRLVPCLFYRERTQALSSLVDSRRVVFVFISTSTSLPGINDNDAVKLEIGN